jgi:hypothetical protein
LACYVINAIVLLVLSGYFIREFITKRLRASLAWGIGFLLFAIAMLNLGLLAAAEVTKPQVMFGFVLTSLMVGLLYYGASLLFFKEGSFFREKMAVIYFLAVLFVGIVLTYITPAEQISEQVRTPSLALVEIAYFVIAVLFLQVSRRIPKEDPRRRTIALVSTAWWIIVIWNLYLAFFWGEYPTIEAGVLLFGTFGFLLLLYGMITGKTTR